MPTPRPLWPYTPLLPGLVLIAPTSAWRLLHLRLRLRLQHPLVPRSRSRHRARRVRPCPSRSRPFDRPCAEGIEEAAAAAPGAADREEQPRQAAQGEATQREARDEYHHRHPSSVNGPHRAREAAATATAVTLIIIGIKAKGARLRRGHPVAAAGRLGSRRRRQRRRRWWRWRQRERSWQRERWQWRWRQWRWWRWPCWRVRGRWRVRCWLRCWRQRARWRRKRGWAPRGAGWRRRRGPRAFPHALVEAAWPVGALARRKEARRLAGVGQGR